MSKYDDSIHVLEHPEEYHPKDVVRANYYVQGFNAGKDSKLQALKEENVKRYFEHKYTAKINTIRQQVIGCCVEVEDAIESQKEEGLPVPDWLKGQLHAFNKCLIIINDLKDNE